MSADQSVAGMRRYLAEVVGEFAAMEFDRMLADARREGAADALTKAADAAEGLWERQGLSGPVFVAHRTPRWLRDRAADLTRAYLQETP